MLLSFIKKRQDESKRATYRVKKNKEKYETPNYERENLVFFKTNKILIGSLFREYKLTEEEVKILERAGCTIIPIK